MSKSDGDGCAGYFIFAYCIWPVLALILVFNGEIPEKGVFMIFHIIWNIPFIIFIFFMVMELFSDKKAQELKKLNSDLLTSKKSKEVLMIKANSLDAFWENNHHNSNNDNENNVNQDNIFKNVTPNKIKLQNSKTETNHHIDGFYS